MNTAVLLLGSNAGNRMKMLADSKELLQQNKIEVMQQSGIYETEAWGLEDQPAFLNQVLITKTDLKAWNLLQILLATEHHMGRVRNKKWEQRCIDIDILFFNKEVIHEEGLKIPHPHLHERRFTLIPLCELMAGYIHPLLNKSLEQLLKDCTDHKEVKLFS